jgi:hypothetical protein
MKKKEEASTLSGKMTKVEQTELAKKLEVLVEKRLGAHYGFSHKGTDSLITLKIVTSEEKYIRWVKDLLKPYNLPALRTRKNHGSGMKTTLLIDVSKISSETKTKIENDFKQISSVLAKKRRSIDSLKPEEKIVNVEQPQNETVISSSEKENRRPRKENPHRACLRYLLKVFSSEGLDFSKLNLSQENQTFRLSGGRDSIMMIKLASEVINYYFGDKVSCVLSDDNGPSLICSGWEETKNSQSKKYHFCPPSPEMEEKDILSRLQRVLKSKKYLSSKDGDGVCVQFKSNKRDDLFLALLEMGWNIKERKHGFIVYPLGYKEPSSENFGKGQEEVKEDAFNKLCELIESEDFNLLDEILKKKLLEKKEDFLKNKRREELSAYAESLLAVLK